MMTKASKKLLEISFYIFYIAIKQVIKLKNFYEENLFVFVF